jgi:hypothetical protein
MTAGATSPAGSVASVSIPSRDSVETDNTGGAAGLGGRNAEGFIGDTEERTGKDHNPIGRLDADDEKRRARSTSGTAAGGSRDTRDSHNTSP